MVENPQSRPAGTLSAVRQQKTHWQKEAAGHGPLSVRVGQRRKRTLTVGNLET